MVQKEVGERLLYFNSKNNNNSSKKKKKEIPIKQFLIILREITFYLDLIHLYYDKWKGSRDNIYDINYERIYSILLTLLIDWDIYHF